MAKQQKLALGRGLDALWGENAELMKEADQSRILDVEINSIDPNREQARKYFDAERLEELSASIKQSGVIQPLILRKNGERYTIVAGERRWRAARLAGLDSIPAIVRDYDDKTLQEVSLIENLQRADLNPVEEAAGIRLLMTQHDLTQEEVSEKIGKSRPAVANSLRLLNLPSEILTMLRDGTLSAGHGRCLAGLPDKQVQLATAKEIEAKSLSVRQTEELCKKTANAPEKDSRESVKKALAPELYDFQSNLQTRLGTKVNLQGNDKRGKIVIEYYSKDQLEQLYDMLQNI